MNLVLRLGLLVILQAVLIAGAMSVGAQTPARQLAYEAQFNSNTEIFLLDIDRRLTLNLTHHPGIDSRPVWSPDGSRLLFESWRNGVRGVYVMNVNSTEVRRLSADAGASEYDPWWAPDGQSIFFRSLRRFLSTAPSVAIYRVDPDGSNLQRVDPGTVSRPRNSEHVALRRYVNGKWGVYVVEGEVTRQLTEYDIAFSDAPRWSQDGSQIAFLTAAESGQTEIFVINADGTGLRQVTADGVPKSSLRWRP